MLAIIEKKMKDRKNMDLSFKSKRSEKNSPYIFYVNYVIMSLN